MGVKWIFDVCGQYSPLLGDFSLECSTAACNTPVSCVYAIVERASVEAR